MNPSFYMGRICLYGWTGRIAPLPTRNWLRQPILHNDATKEANDKENEFCRAGG
jgi:hypothetical protein